MRTVSAGTTSAWQNSYKGGSTSPMVRATIQKLSPAVLAKYDLGSVNWYFPDAGNFPIKETGEGEFCTLMFGHESAPVEIPNIKSVTWTRSVDQDVASMTMVLFNADYGLSNNSDDFEFPGYYTFTRSNEWADYFVPDRMIRTYEGYGFDLASSPENDANLYPSGVWLIDTVEYSSDGLITLSCRDVGRALIDQVLFPPLVPIVHWPLEWTPKKTVTYTPPPTVTNSSWISPPYHRDSNMEYIFMSLYDGSMPYVNNDGSVGFTVGLNNGPKSVDSNTTTNWLTVGNAQANGGAVQYIQYYTVGNSKVTSVKVRAWGGPYTAYISLYSASAGRWIGDAKIPYKIQAIKGTYVGLGAGINFVTTASIPANEDYEISIPEPYASVADITHIRISLTDFKPYALGTNYKYRAGIREFYYTSQEVTPATAQTFEGGNYSDYTTIVKWLLGWAGWYWPSPEDDADIAYFKDSTNSTITYSQSSDAELPKGRIWGDFMASGTVAKGGTLSSSIFASKPVIDGIRYVKDLVAYIFYIDETGGAVFRAPNIWSTGNYVQGQPTRTTQTVLIDEADTLLNIQSTLSSRNTREQVFVSNQNGEYGAILTMTPDSYSSGMRRIAGYTDAPFEAQDDATVMANLIGIRQQQDFRKSTVVIPGYPAIQVDDQVLIQERITGENFRHYVSAITSVWDSTTSKWTYTLTTHWLPPSSGRYYDSMLQQVTRTYLNTILGASRQVSTISNGA